MHPNLTDNAQLFESQMLTYDELAKRIRFPRRTLERYVSMDRIPHIRLGRSVRFYWPTIVEWLSKQKGARRR